MENGVLAALNSDRIVQSKLSAIVTEDCVVLPSFGNQPHMVFSLESITKIKIVKTSYPSLLVIAAGLFLLSAAALSSKDGAGTGWPLGVLGVVFLFAFLFSQRARVVFMLGRETCQTISGSFADVADLLAAVEVARESFLNDHALTGESQAWLKTGVITRLRQWINGLLSPQIRTCDI